MAIGRALLATIVIGVASSAAPALAAVPSWTTYRRDAIRSGVDPDSTSPVPPTQAWQTPALDGDIYGQPLVYYGSTVFVATENDSVYALNSATGAVIWGRHLATPVPSTDPPLPCGDISPTVGITSTPVIDPSTGAIYVVADTWNGSDAEHELFGLSMASGQVVAGPFPVDPAGTTPTAQLQRAALALDDGKVIIGYGGNDGDCSTYHGWLVAVPETGGPLQTFEVDGKPGDSQGAIWGAGNGPAVDGAGNIWFATGNGSSSSFDYSESVIEVGPNLNLLGYWAPSDWQTLDSGDLDLGSSDPVLLPGGLVFEIGKQGMGYLLSQLGGVGGPAYSASVCSGSWGGGIYNNGVIYVACNDGMHALALDTANDTFAPLVGWNASGNTIGPPIFAGGLVWSADYNNGTLYGLNPQTGATSFSSNLGGFDHFGSPSAAGGRLFIANKKQVTAFTIASYTPPSSPPPPPSPPPPLPVVSGPHVSGLHVTLSHGHVRLRLTLSERATITVTVEKCRVRRGGRCRAWKNVRTLKLHGKRGKDSFLLRTKKLRRGDYRLSLIARSRTGQSSPRLFVTFVVPAPKR